LDDVFHIPGRIKLTHLIASELTNTVFRSPDFSDPSLHLYLTVTVHFSSWNVELRSCFRNDTMAQDTQPIFSSAPCHGAKKVECCILSIFIYKDPTKFPAVKT
jgi:hypothetical protein